MTQQQKTIIVTGASQGIGAGVVHAFLARGYNVVATSRSVSKSESLTTSDRLVLVDGDIGLAATAKKVTDTAVEKFGGIDGLVNNAGIFISKAFVDYTAEDFQALVHTNLEGYLYVTQLAIKQMLAQKRGGSVVSISSSLVDNPISSLTASVAMITKGGIDAIKSNPEKIPQVHIRGDVNAPWRCIAGAIYNVQISGYPTVGFISNPVDPNAP